MVATGTGDQANAGVTLPTGPTGDNGVVRPGIGDTTFHETATCADSLPSDTVNSERKVPVAAGTPDTTPVSTSIVNPGGSPSAVHTSKSPSTSTAASASVTATPWSAVCKPGLVMTSDAFGACSTPNESVSTSVCAAALNCKPAESRAMQMAVRTRRSSKTSCSVFCNGKVAQFRSCGPPRLPGVPYSGRQLAARSVRHRRAPVGTKFPAILEVELLVDSRGGVASPIHVTTALLLPRRRSHPGSAANAADGRVAMTRTASRRATSDDLVEESLELLGCRALSSGLRRKRPEYVATR